MIVLDDRTIVDGFRGRKLADVELLPRWKWPSRYPSMVVISPITFGAVPLRVHK